MAAMTTATTTTEEYTQSRRLSTLLAKPAWKAAVQAAALLSIFFAFMALVQFATPNMPDNDGYYHIKLAYLMRSEGLKPDFPWLPLSILNQGEFSDHHFLFHVGLIPFTFGDLRSGAKWAAVVFSSLAFLSVWWLLYRQKVPFAGLWSLGLLVVSEAFIYRMSITRAQSLSLAFLALGLSFILNKNYRWLLALSFLYVWLYDAFPLILFIAGAYTLAVLLLERRLELRPVLYAGLGVGLGVLITPYFPDNLIFLIRHLLPKLTEATSVSVGSEWYPYDTTQLLSNSPLALVAFVAGILALGLQDRRMDVRTATSFFITVLFGLMLFQSRRFIEYFPAFALIFTAFAWTPLIEAWQSRTAEAIAAGHAHKYRLPGWLPAVALLLLLIPGVWIGLRDAQKSIRTAKPYNLYANASAWLQENTPPGERVFQTDWDDFPRLFYYNTHNTYLIGLDPTYMQLYDPELYARWVDITRGRVSNPSGEISERFAARYILTDLQHKDFIDEAEDDPGLKQVYRDGQAIIYRVLD